MIRRRALALCLAGLAQGTVATAETCVGAGFDQPFPGATAVVTRQADVPTPQFPGLWQEGLINGYRYALYANGEAILTEDLTAEEWEIAVDCKAGDCTQSLRGSPPEAAIQIAAQLGQCLVSPIVTPVVTPVVTPSMTEADPPAAEAQPTPVPPPEETKPPCGLATIPASDPGTTLQLLLVAAGADPGPIDGMPGQITQNALVRVLGQAAQGMQVDAAISALDAHLCLAQTAAPAK